MAANDTRPTAIRNLQTYLRQLSYHDPSITPPPIDGVFDTATEQSLRDFQVSRDLPPTGIADRALWELLYASYRSSLAENSPPVRMEIFPLTPPSATLKIGDRGFPVTALQHMLQELEHKYGALLPVEINGVFDSQTENALLAFQKQNALRPNGIVDRMTWNAVTDQYNVLFSSFPIE